MKSKNLLVFFTIVCVASIILFEGCGSATFNNRVTKRPGDKKNGDPSVRFTSEKDNIGEFLTEAENEDDYDEETIENEKIDNSKLRFTDVKKLADINADALNLQEKITVEIIRYLNTPYKYGGNTLSGIDCSGFTTAVFKNALSLSIPRTARDQYKIGETVDDIKSLQFGDLVFFDTRRKVKPGHVGLYIGDNLFVHASRKNGVIITNLNHSYYSKRYMGARRITDIYEYKTN